MKSPNIPCRDVVELVTEYLEGTLAPDERARVEQHLVICPPCVTYIQQMRETGRLVGVAAPAPSDEEKQKLLAIFQDWRARGGKR